MFYPLHTVRKGLQIFVFTLFLLFIPTALAQTAPCTLWVATDLHYISPVLHDNGAYFTKITTLSDGKTMAYIDPLMDAFVEEILLQKPSGVIVSGDLTFNGAKKSHTDLANKFKRIKDSGIPIWVIPGNHDIMSRQAASFDGDGYTFVENVSKEEFRAIYADYGYADAICVDPYSLSYLAKLSDDLYALMIDVNANATVGTVSQYTLAWAEKQLKWVQAQSGEVLAVSHQNVLVHNSVFPIGFTMGGGEKLQALFEQYGVIANLSGHMHVQHIAKSENGFVDIATSSLAVSPNQYGILTLSDQNASYETKPVDVSAYAQKTGSKDENLLHFDVYSSDFFDYSSYTKTLEKLLETTKDETLSESLATYFMDINACYFSGRRDLIEKKDDLLLAWKTYDHFSGAYIESILADTPSNDTVLQWDR